MAIRINIRDIDDAIKKADIILNIKKCIEKYLPEEFQNIEIEEDENDGIRVSSVGKFKGSCFVQFYQGFRKEGMTLGVSTSIMTRGIAGTALASAIENYFAIECRGTLSQEHNGDGMSYVFNKEKGCFQKFEKLEREEEWDPPF